MAIAAPPETGIAAERSSTLISTVDTPNLDRTEIGCDMTNLIGAADWPRTNRAVHRLILGSRLVEKIAHVTVSTAMGDSPESAILRIHGKGGPRLVASEADDGCPTCFEDC